jgi:hypothetical protein
MGGNRESAMSIIKARLPLLARHEGIWEGTYRFITPQLAVNDQYDFRITVSFPDDGQGGITYRQESAYRWSDGHSLTTRSIAMTTGAPSSPSTAASPARCGSSTRARSTSPSASPIGPAWRSAK